MDLDIAHFKLMKENTDSNLPLSPSKANFSERLAGEMFEGKMNSKVLAFKCKAPEPKESGNQHKVLYTCNTTTQSAPKAPRQIAQKPERVLDAPGIMDDYYVNLIDWGKTNVLAVALGTA